MIVDGVVNGLMNGLKSLFIPNETYFEDNFEYLQALFNSKFGDNTSIESLSNVYSNELPEFKVSLYGKELKLVNFSWFLSYKGQIQNIARGFVFPLLLMYNLNQVYFLVRGVNLWGTSRGTNKGE